MADSEYSIDIYKSAKNTYWNSNDKSTNIKIHS